MRQPSNFSAIPPVPVEAFGSLLHFLNSPTVMFLFFLFVLGILRPIGHILTTSSTLTPWRWSLVFPMARSSD